MTGVRKERIPLLWSTVREKELAESMCFLTWGVRTIRVSVEERSCLKGVYTVRKSERQAAR